MPTTTFATRRGQLEHYFDRTAVEAWARLTSDAPVSRIRATVRAGRDRMRATLLSWLPRDMTGMRLLDAGCGTGLLSVEAARRGAAVVAVDVSPTLVGLAGERLPADVDPARLDFRVGDMLDPALGQFDHVVAMDSLIHYKPGDAVQALARLGERTTGSIVFTFAPRTPLLSAMHAAGQLFPRSDRAPAIEPVSPSGLRARIGRSPGLEDWRTGRSERIVSGFYTSQAQELIKGESVVR
ncbi:magnesium protoporphyrin IX methyltransferase [Algihabitans albus]|uniref:magnesium protoporphyrin IX methyltransferase n=1 Tax=Algihabitans albus TaxID=2164067 RepID=UPI000E5CC855|nr:magnesium protoporphyrin IX methyltransferase [Algihabitans albus]